MSDKSLEYVVQRKKKIDADKESVEDNLQKLRYESGVIKTRIDEINNRVDSTFAVFSPHSNENNTELADLTKLNQKKDELSREIRVYENQLDNINCDLDAIDAVLYGEKETVSTMEDLEEDADLSGVKILEQQELLRQKIARELHDSPVQVLTNLVHKCEICSKLIDKDTIRAKLELEVMSKTLRETIDEMRKIIFDLRPMSIDDLGFDVTLRHVVSNIQRDCSMKIHLDIKGEPVELPSVLSLSFIRIIQESLNNSKKHSNANNSYIVVEYFSDKIRLLITDDGQGYDTKKCKASNNNNSGFGISMMKERVYLLAGDINITSKIGQGTAIDVVVPIMQ